MRLLLAFDFEEHEVYFPKNKCQSFQNKVDGLCWQPLVHFIYMRARTHTHTDKLAHV